jgi:hypothetical protein
MHTNLQRQKERERIQNNSDKENILCLNICFVVKGTTKPGEEIRGEEKRQESECMCG